MTALEGRARELGYLELHLDTTVQQMGAQRLYENNGYVLVRESRIAGFDVRFYEKTLVTLKLQTARLDLLPINRDHAEEMFSLLRDESLYRFTGDAPPSDAAALANRYAGWERRTSPDGSELWLNWVLSDDSQIDAWRSWCAVYSRIEIREWFELAIHRRKGRLPGGLSVLRDELENRLQSELQNSRIPSTPAQTRHDKSSPTVRRTR